ncbi:hypothetical protein STA1M1_31100 [Sinisalibacter aestuarii]|uniref:Uncharacterized protein n=1 Tax=Sinisalibacter aestuarii TaxID=2949426 RepID=A0ABQ5LXW8_9RHOB|nr:hypothetical protein STA1M1_31100 [Sinisalibacter aestuarii]
MSLPVPSAFSRATTLQALGPREAPVVPPEGKAPDAAIDRRLSSISISNVRLGEVFNIAAVATDPQKSALLANPFAQLCIRDQIEVRFGGDRTGPKQLSAIPREKTWRRDKNPQNR